MKTSKEKLFSILKEMENTKLNHPIMTDVDVDFENKFNLLSMNILQKSVFAIMDIDNILNDYLNQIIIVSLPIFKYDDIIYTVDEELSKKELEEHLKNGKLVAIYSIVDKIEELKETKYRVKVL